MASAAPPQKRKPLARQTEVPVRSAGFAWALLFGQAALLSGQVIGEQDSVGMVGALAAYALSHPVGVGGAHGPMIGLTVDTVASRWSALLADAIRTARPALWLEPAAIAARDQPHMRITRVEAGGDSVLAQILWRRCYPGDGGESGWPVVYILRRAGAKWRVDGATITLIGHGYVCWLDRGSAR